MNQFIQQLWRSVAVTSCHRSKWGHEIVFIGWPTANPHICSCNQQMFSVCTRQRRLIDYENGHWLYVNDDCWLPAKLTSEVGKTSQPRSKHILSGGNFPPWSFQLVLHPCKAQKSKSAKASCCSAERLKDLGGGDRTGWSRVKSLSKLLTSMDSLIDGRNGGFTFLVSRASQSIVWKIKWTIKSRCASFKQV